MGYDSLANPGRAPILRTKSVTKKEMKKCMAEIYDPLAQWLWYWLINQATLVRISPGSYISAMHLLISFFVTDFVRKTLLVRDWPKSYEQSL